MAGAEPYYVIAFEASGLKLEWEFGSRAEAVAFITDYASRNHLNGYGYGPLGRRFDHHHTREMLYPE